MFCILCISILLLSYAPLLSTKRVTDCTRSAQIRRSSGGSSGVGLQTRETWGLCIARSSIAMM